MCIRDSYNCAYAQAGGGDLVAMELAQQYCASGNYTKAEYTLTNAIADGASKELYLALCRTYVEQDKLLDTVTFLNNITDPQIKAELDAMRPPVPTVNAEPGFYNQYITVTVSGEGGTLYVTSDGAYPTILRQPYDGKPIAMKDGENTVYALVVAENGLVSPLGIFGYTIGGVVEAVTFTDPVMEAALREEIGAEEGTTVLTNDLWGIRSFRVPEGAKDLSDLKYLLFLEELTIEQNGGKGLSALSGLSHLEKLTISSTPVSREDLPAIGSLPMLKQLTLTNCGLSTAVGLENATEITYLDLSGNTIRDVTVLGRMAKLQELHMQHNAMVSLTALSGNTALTVLDVSYNSIEDSTPLGNLKNLTSLNISNNKLESLGGVENLTGLKELDASGNILSTVAGIPACTALEKLDLSNNLLTDITSLSSLNSLMDLNFAKNQVTAIPAFDKNCELVTIDGSNNQITSLEPLRGLSSLNKVNMDYNEELSNVEPLAQCPTLVLVNVYHTKVTSVTCLTDQSIVVNYTPV